MKTKPCPRCKKSVPTDNKGRLKPHVRWDWPNWPSINPTPRSPEMHEVRCE